MTDVLLPINVEDWTGGLNLRRHALQLAHNESPGMINIEVDPAGGFFTRQGWTRWNAVNIIPNPTGEEFEPRSAEMHSLATGTFNLYVTSGGLIYWADQTTVFATLTDGVDPVPCSASPHLADFGPWGDTVYIATGREEPNAWKQDEVDDAVALGFAYNDDYTIPQGGNMPRAEHVEPHGGHLFVANIKEGSTVEHHRLRWSHPSEPEDWATDDFIDISIGGGEITGLKSFYDHLLIFKTDSLWALYGYDSASWQLVQISRGIGTPSPQAITRSESACYFFAAADRGGIYGYSGQGAPVHITEGLTTLFEKVTHADFDDVWLGWMGKRLWASIPASLDPDTTQAILVFDPEVGNGAWVQHRPARGLVGPLITGSDIEAGHPLLVLSAVDSATVMRVDDIDGAFDEIADSYTGMQGEAFSAGYRTRWYTGDWPERRKSWRRVRYLVHNTADNNEIQVSVFRDYDPSGAHRSGFIVVDAASGVAYWREEGASAPEGDGFDWDDGTLWGGRPEGSLLVRAPSLGHARAVQLVFKSTDKPELQGHPWGVDGIFLKVLLREFTT